MLPSKWIALGHDTNTGTENVSSPERGMVGVAFFVLLVGTKYVYRNTK